MKIKAIHVPRVTFRALNAIERKRCPHCLRFMLSSLDGVNRWCTCPASVADAKEIR